MSEPLPEINNNTQLTEILSQLQSLNNRVTYLEEKLKLVSDLDRYGKLQSLLMAGKFKEADLETTAVILDSVNKSRDDLTPDDMTKFPCNILKVIDRLWQDSSGDRFGFSKQLAIYQEVGGSIETLRAQNTQILEKYGDQVGWRKDGKWQGNTYDNWDFSLSAPVGCFPAIWWKSPYGFKMATFCFIRLINCDIS